MALNLVVGSRRPRQPGTRRSCGCRLTAALRAQIARLDMVRCDSPSSRVAPPMSLGAISTEHAGILHRVNSRSARMGFLFHPPPRTNCGPAAQSSNIKNEEMLFSSRSSIGKAGDTAGASGHGRDAHGADSVRVRPRRSHPARQRAARRCSDFASRPLTRSDLGALAGSRLPPPRSSATSRRRCRLDQ